MMNPKGLAQMRRKWQKLTAIGRKRFTLERQVSNGSTNLCTTQLVHKGHFVVYTVDKKRFEIPLDNLNSGIPQLLFKQSEEEFGYSAGGPITLACDGEFMEYLMELVRRQMPEEVERAIMNLFSLPCHQTLSAKQNRSSYSTNRSLLTIRRFLL